MAKQNEHGKLIAAAAKAALAPLGCKRIGQSRCWVSDHRSWVIMVEFQPSAWEKGTYLNVWPIWLWLRMSLGHTDIGKRVGDFIPFHEADQFADLIGDLAEQAAQRVIELRRRFQTLADVNGYFATRITGEGFPVYRAAVTAGLAGDLAAARSTFRRIQEWDPGDFAPWIELKSESAVFAKLLDKPERYRSNVLAAILESRKRLRLPPDPQCLEGMDARFV
jgi:hypothetical protein